MLDLPGDSNAAETGDCHYRVKEASTVHKLIRINPSFSAGVTTCRLFARPGQRELFAYYA